jgi:hypothetical protein
MVLLARAALATARDRWDQIKARLTPSFAALWEQLASQLDGQIDRDTLQRARLSSAVEVSLKGAIHQLRQQVGSDTSKAIQRQMAVGLYTQLADFSRANRPMLWGQSWVRPVDGAPYYLHEHLLGQIQHQGNYLMGGFTNSFAIDPWSTWETLYTFCIVLEVDYSPRQAVLLDLCLRTVRALHFWMPCDGIVLCAERPGPPSLDERGRLHGPGLVCAYNDGWGVAAWEGIPLPVKYQDPRTYAILSEPNAEMRRMLIERYDAAHGKGCFILDAGAKVIDSAVQPMHGREAEKINELLGIDLPGDPDHRMVALKVIDPSTGRVYVIRVPPDQTTVRGALAWTFGVEPDQYILQQET